MGKILVTRIASLGLAAYIFRETIYREKPRNLWGETLLKFTYVGTKNAAAQPTIHTFIYEKIKYDYFRRQSTISERISRKLSDAIDF